MTDNHTVIDDVTRGRFISEIVANAGPEGLSDEDLDAALAEFIEMHITAAALELWNQHRMRIAWRDGQMLWRSAANEGTNR